MNIAILLAGGVGQRFGADKAKQFVDLLGKPMIVYAMQIYEDSPVIDALEVVCVPEYIAYVWELAKEYHITKLKWVCAGGASCQESTRNGIFNLEGVCRDEDILTFNMNGFYAEMILDRLKVSIQTKL